MQILVFVLLLGLIVVHTHDEKEFKYPEIAWVMHAGDTSRYQNVRLAENTWLKDTKYVVMDGRDHFDRRHRELLHVIYDGNPGCYQEQRGCKHEAGVTYSKIGKYWGAHRTLAGVYVANYTYAPDWIVVFDDDNFVEVERVHEQLKDLDPTVPLLLASAVGPMHHKELMGECRDDYEGNEWGCCRSLDKPCRVHLDEANGTQAVFKYNMTTDSFYLDHYCGNDLSWECCKTRPWPEGVSVHYPMRLAKNGTYTPHFAHMWPYGGFGYAISRGMLETVGKEHWERCMYGIQCSNADMRIMTCILNAGYAATRFPLNGIAHGQTNYQALEERVKKWISRTAEGEVSLDEGSFEDFHTTDFAEFVDDQIFT